MKLFREHKIFSSYIAPIAKQLELVELYLSASYLILWATGLMLINLPQEEFMRLYLTLSCMFLGLLYLLRGLGVFTYFRLYHVGIHVDPISFPPGFVAFLIYTTVFVLAFFSRQIMIALALLPGILLGTVVGLLWVNAIGIPIGRLKAIYEVKAIRGAAKVVATKNATH